MPKKFVPKIPPRVSPGKDEGNLKSANWMNAQADPHHGIHQENVVLIRVKRRRDEVSKQIIVIGRDDSERESKRVVTAEDQLSRLTVGEIQPEVSHNPIETKVFKLIGTAPMSSPIILTGKTAGGADDVSRGEVDTSGNVDTVNILKCIKEHCKLRECSRNVKRDNRQTYFDAKTRARYSPKHVPFASRRVWKD
jgi:hypothetical protein